MRVFITGGTGFVGSRFHLLLNARGDQTVRYDLIPPVDGDQAGFVQGDIRDLEKMTAAMKGCDAVLHLAAAHHDFGITAATFEEVNVEGTQRVCDAMDANGITNVCFYSTVAVYGDQQPPVDESSPTMPVTDYGKTKLKAESICQHWAHTTDDRRCLVIRPTVIFGPNHFANMYSLIRQIEGGKFVRVGKMDNTKSLAYIDNIVDATLKLWPDANQLAYECVNYVDKPDLISRQIVEEIYKSLGRRPSKFYLPFFAARILALPFDLVIAITGKNLPISTARIEKLALANTRYEADRIHKLVKSSPVSIAEGIQKMVDWYLTAGKTSQPLDRRPPANCQGC